MQFLFPTFLWALALLAIPVIIHLFYFRRFRKVYFTNVRFLREVKEDTSARSKLRNLLVLLARVLALAFLILAFVQPFIPQDSEVKAGRKAVSIFVDNSFSMSALSEDVPLLDKAKQRAREIVQAYGVEDRFQILTNDFEGRHQRLVSQEDAIALIDELTISPNVKELSKVMIRQKQALETGDIENRVSYIISDFQKNITDLGSAQDSSVSVNLLPLQAVQERNISIDSAWFAAPVQMLNQNNPLIVQVRNLSKEVAENIRLSIRYDGQTKPVGTLEIPAESVVTDTVNVPILRPGRFDAELAITDYPVQFDDHYYFAFDVDEKINVLVVNGGLPNRYLEAAFQGISYFQLTTQLSQNLDYSRFPDYQMILLNELDAISTGLASELQQYVENGGNLLVFPSRNAQLSTYQSFLSGFPANELTPWQAQAREVGSLNTEEFIFSDVFENRDANLLLPSSQGNFGLTNYSSRREEPLMQYRDGNRYLVKYRIGQGHLYLSTVPLNEDVNNLVRNGEIFIPMLYKMAISSGYQKPIAYTIGRDQLIVANHQPSSGEIVYKLKGEDEEFIPEQRIVGSKVYLSVGEQVRDAGYYELFLNPDEILDQYAFNYDRKESDLAYYNIADLEGMIGPGISIIEMPEEVPFETLIEERSQGIVLWRWCLVLTLLFLAVEIILLRFWKT
ncbi:MAG: BatA domain-containing protein [Saprospiraceae bacterium]